MKEVLLFGLYVVWCWGVALLWAKMLIKSGREGENDKGE